MLRKLRFKLIEILAGKEPVLMNWHINSSLVKGGASVVYVPLNDDKIDFSELSKKAVLTPVKNKL